MSSEDVSKDQADANQQNDEWIVQAKTRRLVPQHSLSRQDLEADKNKVVATPKKGWWKSYNILTIPDIKFFLVMYCTAYSNPLHKGGNDDISPTRQAIVQYG